MRAWIVVIGLLVARPCWAQPTEADKMQADLILVLVARSDVQLAFACGLRDKIWFEQKSDGLSRLAVGIAQNYPQKMGGRGGVVAAQRYVAGASDYASSFATLEQRRYGDAICQWMQASGRLPQLDSFNVQ